MKEFPEQTIAVLIASSLMRGIWICEEEGQPQIFLDAVEAGKLATPANGCCFKSTQIDWLIHGKGNNVFYTAD